MKMLCAPDILFTFTSLELDLLSNLQYAQQPRVVFCVMFSDVKTTHPASPLEVQTGEDSHSTAGCPAGRRPDRACSSRLLPGFRRCTRCPPAQRRELSGARGEGGASPRPPLDVPALLVVVVPEGEAGDREEAVLEASAR